MRGLLAATGVLALPLGLMTAAQAEEQADVLIRGYTAVGDAEDAPEQRDVTENRNLGNGSFEFLSDGIDMRAPGGPDRSGVYWEVASDELPASASLDWSGTQTVISSGSFDQPAVVIYFDTDGAGPNPREALLLESVYGDEAWLPDNANTTDEAIAAAPNNDPAGGNGSRYFGTLADWKENLEELPDLEVLQVGVNLSGVAGTASEGLLRSVTLDDDTYTFTSDEEAPVEPEPTVRDVNGGVSAERTDTRIAISMTSQGQPADTVEGAKLRWRIAVDGFTEASFQQGFGEQDTFNRRFAVRSGRHTVRVFKNGEQVREYVFRTNR